MSLSKEEVDQLLEIASKPLVNPKQDKASDVYSFILDRCIEPGDTPITPAKVYDVFKEWSTNIRDTSVFKTSEATGEAAFYKEFKRYFNHQRRRRNGTVFYLLNSNSFDMSEKAEQELIERLKKKHGKKE